MLQAKNKFYKVTLIFYSILSIASTLFLLFKPDESIERYDETKQELEFIETYLRQKDDTYQQTIDSLKHRGDSLQSVIESTDEQLNESRIHSKRVSGQLTDYIEWFESDTSQEKNATAFDSLSHLSLDLVLAHQVQDSLCAQEITLLSDLVEVKDSIIVAGDSLLGDYKSSVGQLLQTSNELNEALHQSEKKLKRKTRLCRALSVGVALTSGYLIYKIL